jgi:hypothetical protein
LVKGSLLGLVCTTQAQLEDLFFAHVLFPDQKAPPFKSVPPVCSTIDT